MYSSCVNKHPGNGACCTVQSTSGRRVAFNPGSGILRDSLINWLCPGDQGCQGSDYIRNKGLVLPKEQKV